MFGYVNVNRNELSDENKKIYQSYYCGLCQNLKHHFGAKGQLLLNYDIAFLTILLTGLYEPEVSVRDNFKCTLHPFKRRELRSNEILDYASYMNVLLAYHNLMDDYSDNKSTIKKQMANSIKKHYKKASELYPRQASSVEAYMRRLAEFEARDEQNVDLVAGLTGEMLGELFAMRKDEWYDELKTLGMYLGKFIYLMDAYEDIDKDITKGNYNPLKQLKEDDSKNFEIVTKQMMTSMMSECAKSFERLPILLHADILRNILYSGIWTKYEFIQVNKAKKEDKK